LWHLPIPDIFEFRYSEYHHFYLVGVNVDLVEVLVIDLVYILEVVKQILTILEICIDEHLLDAHNLFFLFSVDFLIDLAVAGLPHVASYVDF